MSWNGSGVYSRGYPSWSADAAANLPISATKFDTEDNDFASGINLCLTKDGQSVPNASLAWALANGQVLALTRGSDGAVFSVGRTGGTNNPALSFTVTDASGLTIAILGNTAISITNAGAVSFPSGIGSLGGPVTITAPGSAATALGVNSYSGFAGINTNAASGSAYMTYSLNGTIYGYVGVAGNANQIIAGAALGDLCFRVAANAINFSVNGGTSIQVSLSSAGQIAVAAPSSGTTLSVAGATSANAVVVTQADGTPGIKVSAANGVAPSYQLTQTSEGSWTIVMPASSTDLRFNDGTADRAVITAGSGMYLHGATGGAQGDGTLNVQGIYINGIALSAGIPQNAQFGSTYTFVLSDANKQVFQDASGTHIYTIPANASVAFPIGTTIILTNGVGAGNLTLNITSDTLNWLPTGATGSRTIAGSGQVTLLKVSATVWYLTGVGVS